MTQDMRSETQKHAHSPELSTQRFTWNGNSMVVVVVEIVPTITNSMVLLTSTCHILFNDKEGRGQGNSLCGLETL